MSSGASDPTSFPVNYLKDSTTIKDHRSVRIFPSDLPLYFAVIDSCCLDIVTLSKFPLHHLRLRITYISFLLLIFTLMLWFLWDISTWLSSGHFSLYNILYFHHNFAPHKYFATLCSLRLAQFDLVIKNHSLLPSRHNITSQTKAAHCLLKFHQPVSSTPIDFSPSWARMTQAPPSLGCLFSIS